MQRSISVKNWATSLSVTPPPSDPFPLLGSKASISSKKRIPSPILLTFSNTYLKFFSLSPTYILSNSGPLTLKNGKPHSFATHFAIKVLPVPGGP